jgi:type I restriction enzyme M protein
MLTPHLKKLIDGKWDNCWPVSNLRPLAILDLISYLFFLKKLDDLELINKGLPSTENNHFIYSKEIEQFSWTTFKNIDAQAMHHLFTKEYGLLDLMQQYGQTDSLYSNFFKERLLITPTPKLLLNGIEIINLIESSDPDSQAAIAEYLFRKAETVQNQSQFIPEHISRLMISIAEPTSRDVIFDPVAGNASLLINAAEYVENNQVSTSFYAEKVAPKLKGIESNVIHLRMAAMRMILHGLKTDDLLVTNGTSVNNNEKPTLILCSLISNPVEGNVTGEDLLPQTTKFEKETELLNQILQNLETGARAVILLPENLLNSNLPELQSLRKNIVGTTNLQGVINLSPDGKSLFSAAGILIFDKVHSSATNKVWFCKMEKPKKKRTVNEMINNPDENNLLSDQMNEMKFLLDKWKNRDQSESQGNKCFFISGYDIKANKYSLIYNDYKLISPQAELKSVDNEVDTEEGNAIIAANKENLHHFFEASPSLEQPKKRRNLFPTLLLIFLLLIAGGWVYFFNIKGSKPAFLESNINHPAASAADIPVSNSGLQPNTEGKKTQKKQANTIKDVSDQKSTPVQTDSSTEYTVIDKAWFHSEPDSTKRKPVFLQPRKDLVLTPKAEENGFVYVVYINKKGQATHGWLDKRDLEPVE